MARALYQAIIISFIAWKVCTSFWSMYVYIYIYINNKKTSLAVCVCCP